MLVARMLKHKGGNGSIFDQLKIYNLCRKRYVNYGQNIIFAAEIFYRIQIFASLNFSTLIRPLC